ncbi:MAG TPA: threonine ammonia-lyase, partial [Casimicrobium sp.]|nr:threonine ammonia-lyase [Casimicrobium sp.]
MKEVSHLPVTLADVQTARDKIAGAVQHTPCLHSKTLSRIFGCEVWLKFENLQFTASFKERGALNKLLSLTAAEKARGVIAMSAGNHAQGVAYHAGRLGIPATIVMPAYTPFVKVRNTEGHGAKVVLFGNTLAEASQHARALAAEHQFVFVHPYDDPYIIAGQGTLALEMLEAAPQLDTLIIPVGGGGLIAGCAVAARGVKPSIEIIGVESKTFPAMSQRLRGEAVNVGTETIAEGLAVRDTGEMPMTIARALVKDVLLVDESTIEEAIALLIEIEKTVTEGAGATGVAALLQHRERFVGKKVGVVLCGGNI